MILHDFIEIFEQEIPLSLQESWDNSGLQVGDPNAEISSVLLCLDVSENVIDEAVEKNCQLIVSHHPLLFSGLKTIQGQNSVERCVIKAIKNNIAIYSAHTNTDNWHLGVNWHLAQKLQLENCQILQPQAHDVNGNPAGSGYIGELSKDMDEMEFLQKIKSEFKLASLRHTDLLGKPIRKVAICGGSGSFLTQTAINQGADIFISGDFKYHDFFLAENKIVIADIGHYESEIHTKEIFFELISKKIATFAAYLSEKDESPINYL